MLLEQLNNNKIKIILSSEDFINNKIDFYSFINKPIKSQSFFIKLLNNIENETGFITKNYNIQVETFIISNKTFILNISRSLPKNNFKKIFDFNINKVFCFTSFENYCNFISFLKNNKNIKLNLNIKINLFEYKNKYYLVFENLEYNNLNNIISLNKIINNIYEYGYLITNSDIFKTILYEKGKNIIKNNALNNSIKYL